MAAGALTDEARRNLRLLLERLPRNRFELHLAGAHAATAPLAPLPADVPTHELDAAPGRAVARLAGLAGRLRADVLIFAPHDLSLGMLRRRASFPETAKLVVRADPALAGARASLLARRRWRREYARAHRVVCNSDALRRELATRLSLPAERLVRVYDPVDVERLREQAATARNPLAARGLGPHVLAIGSITPQERHETLVDALPPLVAQFPDARLWILGDDPSGGGAETLRARAEELGVGSSLHLVGPPEHPGAWLAHADLLAVASQSPDPPPALLQALACECPVVALAPSAATQELLRATGCESAARKELDWQREWFRGGADAPGPRDLSAFEPEAAVEAWVGALGD
ncbi:MAG: glycosyltransferase [Deltaproteobacteria bacterium]|nr:glycosyltransferase [Deltaproteobacteria bacterium]MBW2412963.1 glycosyltransferase [Deltaproteobacteria bacterium]